jgi:DNA polymerase-1
MVDGDRLHCSINTCRAKTGRMSITEPALQTLPRGPEIRDCFIPAEGHKLISADYDQIEYRLFAHFAAEQTMLEAIRNGEDLHQATADALGVPRQVGKGANFATLFGAGLEKFASSTGLSVEDAQPIRERYLERFPGVRTFMKTMESVAKQRLENEGLAYVRTPAGRRLTPDEDQYYTLVNYICQGTAAEVLKEAMLDLDAAGLGDFVLLPVHDELIFDVPADAVDEAADAIEDAMNNYKFSAPLTVGVDVLPERWGDKSRKAA